MTWATPPTFVPGEYVLSAKLNTVRDDLKAVGDPWLTWTPTLTGWTQGNGTSVSKYMQAGATVWGRFVYTVGSTDTLAGTLAVSLPVTPVTSIGLVVGTAGLFDTSTSNRLNRFVFFNSSTTFSITSETDVRVTSTSPWTWATGDQIRATFFYEAV